MPELKGLDVPEGKPLTERHLKAHFKALDAAFRGFGALFKTLTYEQGRISAEFDTYPPQAKKLLGEAIVHINEAGSLIRRAALQARAKARGINEEEDK